MSDPGPWLALLALANLIWYLVEWDQSRSSGRALSPLRHPALLFVQAIRKLARARQLMLPLLALWLLSALVYWGVQRPLMLRRDAAANAPAGQRMATARPPSRMAEPPRQPFGTLLQLGWEGLRKVSGPLPTQALRDCLPGPTSLRADLWPGYSQLLYAAIVLLCVNMMVWRRPAWLGRANTLQPRLALAYLLVPLALMILANVLSPRSVPTFLLRLLPLLSAFSFIPLYAPVWHLLLQHAQGRRLSLTLAVRSTMAGLVPLTGFLGIVLVGPYLLWSAADALFPTHSAVAQTLFRLPELLRWALVFVPWLILHERLPLRRALRRHGQLLAAHGPDLLAFAARYLLLIFPLQYVHAMFAPFSAAVEASLIGRVVGGLTSLVTLLMVALLVLELERATPRARQDSSVRQGICPAEEAS